MMAENDWAQPAPEMLASAKARALAALRSPDAPRKLRRFYDTTTDYAGASFAAIGLNAPDGIEADDLFAITLLSVGIPAKGARLFTGDRTTRRATSSALAGLPKERLEAVDVAGLDAMGGPLPACEGEPREGRCQELEPVGRGQQAVRSQAT